ncbi:MotA/TolQ/ExbB proton channel family protein [Novosphingobium bradum]|uniref:MotA/TolQ/ExbB proton channel family protein n=1 Tax=Novosphingobium bradum TaxID=1737444 RepID=A0ABV7IVU8_9SPHN
MHFPLIDPTAALIVIGGMLLATLLRCGPGEIGVALRGFRAALGRGYRADDGRAELAASVRAIREDGLLRARPADHVDPAFAEATEALVHDRSLDALLAALERHRARRLAEAGTAVRVFVQAAELAPVFGMAGTLVALSRLSASDLAAPTLNSGEAITGAIALAVVTTLYGILLANLILAPVARLVERAAAREETARQEVVDWLAAQVAEALPRRHPVHARHHALEQAFGAEAA